MIRILSHILVESKLGERLREKMCMHYGHLSNFYDFPGPAIFAMAMYICNASRHFDIDLAQDEFDDITLEDVTACTDAAQKYINILQNGYAPPFRTGSKLLKKLTFALLDLVNKMEETYKLADHNDYTTLGPIGIVTWYQRSTTNWLLITNG
jgi:hypothetical protein